MKFINLFKGLVCLTLFITSSSFALSNEQQIATLLSSTFDNPTAKVKTSPIVVEGDIAIADWIQGEKGGRALLKKSKDKWEITACGGGGFKHPEALIQAGVQQSVANRLTTKLADAEKKLSAKQIQMFDSFGETVSMDRGHDNHHQQMNKH
jgi:hypothetical protein